MNTMRQLTFNLVKKSTRPILQTQNIKALLDTGAEVPVWVASKRAFLAMFPNAVLQTENASLKGFSETVMCPAYNCSFCLGELVFNNIPILIQEMSDSTFQLILSASMFRGLILEFDMINYKLNITIPRECDMVRNLQLIDSNGNMHILLNENVDNTWSKYCTKFYIKDEESEILRLQKLYNTTDRSELLRKIEHDFLT